MRRTIAAACAVLVLLTLSASYGFAIELTFTPPPPPFVTTTRLLFPFVINQNGFDTAITIANTSANPFGTATQSGTCTLNFFGAAAPANPITTPTIAAGTVFTTLASLQVPGFQGYLIANCSFGFAEGVALVSDLGARTELSSYVAKVLPLATPLLSNEP